MTELKQCKDCNGTFQYTTNDQQCLTCSQKNELEFQQIKSYLRQHPKSSIGAIATILDISVSNIQKYLDEGRLEIIEKPIIK
ncbi:MAG TPA: MerR family transcriptional regulator [Clostridiaceae bacterium]